MHIWSIRKQT